MQEFQIPLYYPSHKRKAKEIKEAKKWKKDRYGNIKKTGREKETFNSVRTIIENKINIKGN
jgi:hypothetical protein